MTLMRDNIPKSVKISPASCVMLFAVIFLLTDMNRSELQDNMIQQILDDMDIKTMMAILYDNMSESYDKYSDAELLEEVKEYYPHILEESNTN